MSDPLPSGVTFTMKEMLERIDRKIDRIESRMDEKADASEILSLRTNIHALRGHVSALELGLHALRAQVETQDKVNSALEHKSASNFTRGEKMIALLLAAVAIGIQVYVVWGT